jgi:excisionase family DNA binding protein
MAIRQALSPAARDEVRTVLGRAGLPDDPVRFVELVKDAVRRLVLVRHDPSALTALEIRELRDIGLNPAVSTSHAEHAFESSAATMTAILADSLTVEAAAKLLGLHQSRVRQMLSDRSMYGIKDGAEWRLPAFQFVGRRQVRNGGAVLRAVPGNVHPIELFNWLTKVEPALAIDGRAVSPLEWLELGGDATRPAAIAAEL